MLRTLMSLTLLIGAVAASSTDFEGKWQGTMTLQGFGNMRARIELTRVDTSSTELNGAWTGTIDKVGPSGRVTYSKLYVQLVVRGNEVSGTAHTNEQDHSPILQGKVNGERITFEWVPVPDEPLTIQLLFIGGRLIGEAMLNEEKAVKHDVVSSVILKLRSKGDAIEGTIGPSEEVQIPISNVRRNGKMLSFRAMSPRAIVRADLVLTNDGLLGVVETETDGHVRRGPLMLARQAP